MKVIRNRLIPFRGFVAINLLGWVFVRKDLRLGIDLSPAAYAQLLRHEQTHTLQMRELGYVFFYLWYVLEWLLRFARCGKACQAYLNICFEREAYAHQHDPHYHARRSRWAFWHFLRA